MLTIRQRNIFDSIARPRAEHHVCNIMGQINKLTDSVLRFKSKVERPGYIGIRVPLFASMIFKRAATLDEVYEIMLEQRRKCLHLREAHEELYDYLHRNDVSALQKAKAQNRYIKNWHNMIGGLDDIDTAIATYANSQGLLLKNTGKLMLSAMERKPVETYENTVKTVNALLDIIDIEELNAFQSWTLRPIKSAAVEYLCTPDIDLHRAAKRLFGIESQSFQSRMKMLAEVLKRY